MVLGAVQLICYIFYAIYILLSIDMINIIIVCGVQKPITENKHSKSYKY